VDRIIQAFVEPQDIAVVGVSRSRTKFGRTVYKTLQKRGFTVYPVHPTMTEYDGGRCYTSLIEVPDVVTSAVIVVKPERAGACIEDAAAGGIKRIWLQQGADFSEVAARARELGLEVVVDKCILMYSGEVTGIHSLHRFFARLAGKY